MNKIILITGCTNGIGRETVLGVAPKAEKLILVSRSQEKLTELALELAKLHPRLEVVTYECDFLDLPMVVKISKQIALEQEKIDVLINNAGTWESKQIFTADGFEYTWTVNYFAPYLFTFYLLDTLKNTAKQTGDVRLIILGSEAHRQGKIDYNDLFKYGTMLTYATSKKADMLWSNSLARELGGTGITVNSVHPGVVATGLWAKIPKFLSWAIMKFMISPAQGAETTVYLATREKLTDTGKYWDKCEPAKPTADIEVEQVQDTLEQHTRKLLAKYLP